MNESMSERITETDYRVEQQRLNAQGRAAKHGRLVASSPQIRANGYELRRTPTGSALVQVRKPQP